MSQAISNFSMAGIQVAHKAQRDDHILEVNITWSIFRDSVAVQVYRRTIISCGQTRIGRRKIIITHGKLIYIKNIKIGRASCRERKENTEGRKGQKRTR